MYFYYIGYPVHGEVKDIFFFLYLFLVWLLYVGYKVFQYLALGQNITIRPSHLVYWFLIQYLLVCIYFFIVSWLQPGLWILLFLKSLWYIISAAVIWVGFYCFWKKLLSLHSSTHIDDTSIQTLVSVWLGFIFSMFFIFLTISIWFYSFPSIVILFFCIVVVSIPQWKEFFMSFQSLQKVYKREPGQLWGSISLMIDELLFIIITLLLSVNFLSVFRPFPIGWDDLWAYMNFPKLIYWAWEHLALWKMYLWELYTSIGFLAWSQTFTFYLNSFSWCIAVMVIYLSINIFTKSTKSKYNLGLLASCIFLMMPMVVFQLAKDMKIDIGLFSISIIGLSLLYYLLFSWKKSPYILYWLLGLIVWSAFAIKVTSLLLLLWVLAAVFYNKYKTFGLIAFTLLFVGVFSIAQLWDVINVVISWDANILKYFGLWSCIIWILILCGLFLYDKNQKNQEYIKIFSLQICSILLWFFVALSPWIIKHTSEIPEGYDTWISTYISGVSGKYDLDYLKIYSQDQIDEIKSAQQSGINTSGITSNEDWGRYLWYETGINNFLKLPWNLTLQLNQKWEFTDITFLFLALIPWIFLFLPYRKEVYRYPLIAVIFLTFLYYIPTPIWWVISGVFSHFNLPWGYAIIIALFFLPIIYLSWALDKTHKEVQLFLLSLAFLTIYMWLWAVSSYGVVWYGVVMYFVLLLLISLCISSATRNDTLHNYASYLVMTFVVIYAFQSAIPHAITNIRSAGYQDYKIGAVNEEVAVMTYHPEYFPIMYELNISDDVKKDFFIEYRNRVLSALSTTKDFNQILPQIQSYTSMVEVHKLIVELARVDFPEWNINSQIQDIRQDLYELVIYTPQDFKNVKNIYRAGTFLKYFISENNTRLLEDNLIMKFDTYIYSDDSSTTTDRFKKLGLDYILLDLNAATIDNDPAKDLTRRYENMLWFVAGENIELIETDSICLRIAKDNYLRTNDMEWYLTIAWVNHSSSISQSQKRQLCFAAIQQIISQDTLLAQYPYLNWYKNVLINSEVDITSQKDVVSALSRLIRWNGFKALFKIN